MIQGKPYKARFHPAGALPRRFSSSSKLRLSAAFTSSSEAVLSGSSHHSGGLAGTGSERSVSSGIGPSTRIGLLAASSSFWYAASLISSTGIRSRRPRTSTAKMSWRASFPRVLGFFSGQDRSEGRANPKRLPSSVGLSGSIFSLLSISSPKMLAFTDARRHHLQKQSSILANLSFNRSRLPTWMNQAKTTNLIQNRFHLTKQTRTNNAIRKFRKTFQGYRQILQRLKSVTTATIRSAFQQDAEQAPEYVLVAESLHRSGGVEKPT